MPAATAEGLREPEVNQAEPRHRRLLVPFVADDKVLRFEVAVNEARLVMQRLQPGQDLDRNHANCFRGKVVVPPLEQGP